MKLGILITAPPISEDAYTAKQIALHALKLNHEVSIFLMSDGVYNLLLEDLKDLVKAGAKIFVCEHNATERGVKEVEGVVFGSQVDHAEIIHECDRFINFG